MRLSRSSWRGALLVLSTLTACSPVRQTAAPTTISQPAATPTRLPLTAVATGIYVPAYAPPAIATNLTNPGGTSAMAFSSGLYGNAGIYLADFTNKTITQLTNARGNSFDPDWSPDGTKIIFRTDRDGKPPFTSFDAGQIYVMNADGSNQTNLTNNLANEDGWPKWSPDGTRIVFASYRDDRSNTEVYVMNADGSGVTQLTDTPGFNNEDVAWSPDGQKIVFKSYRDRDWEIYTMNADGSGQTRLTNSPGEDARPNWSPDGKQIVFETQRAPGNADFRPMYIMNSDGTNPTQVVAAGFVGGPKWSPDGTEIAFYANGDQGEGIFMVNVASGEIVKLISDNAGDPSWRPIKP